MAVGFPATAAGGGSPSAEEGSSSAADGRARPTTAVASAPSTALEMPHGTAPGVQQQLTPTFSRLGGETPNAAGRASRLSQARLQRAQERAQQQSERPGKAAGNAPSGSTAAPSANAGSVSPHRVAAA